MSEVFPAGTPATAAIDAAGRALAAGGCVVFPTDTVYGVGARPDVRGATDRLFEVKRRPRDLTLPVLVAGTADAETVARLDDRARRLAERFWPGALTMVLPRTSSSTGWDLGAEEGTVGIRVPAHSLAEALLSRTGPLAVTSANVSGQRPASTCDGVRAALGGGVAVYICAEGTATPVPSTVIDLTGGDPLILREGAIAPEDVLAALR